MIITLFFKDLMNFLTLLQSILFKQGSLYKSMVVFSFTIDKKGKTMKKIILTLLLLLFSACSQPSPKVKTPSFENTKYTLVSFGNKRMAVPKNAWIRFDNGRYSGNAGCNGMGGEYILQGKSLEFKAGMSTMMACEDMSLETKFRQEMQKVTSYRFEHNQLILMHEGYAVLNFIAVPSE